MKKIVEKPRTAEQEYPELSMLTDVIAKNIITEINNTISDNISLVRTKCPYPNQCVLEMVIAKLERCV